MSDPTEQAELESVLTSGGWLRFIDHCEKEWGPAGETYQQAVQRAISGGVGSEAEAVHRLKNVAYAQNAIRELLRWPQNRVAQIKGGVKRAEAADSASRRGPGL